MVEPTDFKLQYVIDVIKALNELLIQNKPIITCKRVRDFEEISNKDRSRINFYWRTLRMLERHQFLIKSKHQSGNSVKYEILEPIKLEDVLREAKNFFMPPQTRINDYVVKRDNQIKSYFDWELSFKRSRKE